MTLASYAFRFTLLASGICTYTNPGVLDRVAAYRRLSCRDCTGMIAVADCAYLGRRVWLSVADGRTIGPLLSVDCGAPRHRPTQIARGLVADLPVQLWNHLGLPNAPVPCELVDYRPIIRPEGTGELP